MDKPLRAHADGPGPELGWSDLVGSPLLRVSATKSRLLEALEAEPRTATELARGARLNKASVHRHLQHLVDHGFLARESGTKGRVFYALTPKGRGALRLLRSIEGFPPA